MLSSQHANLKKALEKLLLAIAKETGLIQEDNLARGQLVHSAIVNASLKSENDESHWRWFYQNLRTPVMAEDPPEYWGDFSLSFPEDFIAGTDEYPWMPEAVSKDEMSF